MIGMIQDETIKKPEKKTMFSLKIREASIARFRRISASQRGTQADIFDDMLQAYEEKHLKKGGIFGLRKKEGR